MKKLLLFAALFMAVPMFVGCDDEEEVQGGLRKSDLYGTWESYGGDQLRINSNGTYTFDGVYVNYGGTWTFDGYARTWVTHRDDGHSYTNIILHLDKTTFSYTDQYGNLYNWSR